MIAKVNMDKISATLINPYPEKIQNTNDYSKNALLLKTNPVWKSFEENNESYPMAGSAGIEDQVIDVKFVYQYCLKEDFSGVIHLKKADCKPKKDQPVYSRIAMQIIS